MASSHLERLSSSTLQSYLLASCLGVRPVLFPHNGVLPCLCFIRCSSPAVTQYAPLCHLMCCTKGLCGCVVCDILNSVDICMLPDSTLWTCTDRLRCQATHRSSTTRPSNSLHTNKDASICAFRKCVLRV